MSKKVIYARLHQAAHVPGAGELGSVFPPNGGKTLFDLDMHVSEIGLAANFTYRGIRYETLVPLANVVLMQLAPEEKKSSK